MKVTAFHMVNKVEEAAHSYFSNSLIFGSQTVHAERMVNFRRGHASLHFFLDRGEDAERVSMGGLDIESVQERDNKVAFQCRLTIQPTGESQQFFLMVTASREPFSQYTRIVDLLRVRWERNMNAYLPKGEDGMPALPAQPDEDDEYEGLTAEEIEAVTGSRPAPRGTAAKSTAPTRSAPQPEPAGDTEEHLSADDIQRLMGMALGGGDGAPGAADDHDPTSGMMSLEDIEALTREFQPEPAKPNKSKAAPPPEEEETELSAEDIWKQITGGK